jgi:hypothetical protein
MTILISSIVVIFLCIIKKIFGINNYVLWKRKNYTLVRNVIYVIGKFGVLKISRELLILRNLERIWV